MIDSGTEKKPEISIVVPVMNEAGNVIPLMEAILDVYGKRHIEMIFVDDASSDDTAAELAAMQQRFPQLRVLAHSHRCGQSAAMRSGIMAARAPLIATLDGDGQNLPSDLPKLEAAHAEQRCAVGADGSNLVLVAGVRLRRRDSWAKRQASLAARRIRRWCLGDSHPDSGCGIRMFDRQLFLQLPYFDHFHRFMPALAHRQGAVVVAVPVGHAARQRGVSKYRVLDRLIVGISDLLGVMWLIRRHPRRLVVQEKERLPASKTGLNKSVGKGKERQA